MVRSKRIAPPANVSPAKVSEALSVAASALAGQFRGSDGAPLRDVRFPTPARWAELRQLVHTLSDKDRATAVLRLLLEAGQRQEHDAATARVWRTR